MPLSKAGRREIELQFFPSLWSTLPKARLSDRKPKVHRDIETQILIHGGGVWGRWRLRWAWSSVPSSFSQISCIHPKPSPSPSQRRLQPTLR